MVVVGWIVWVLACLWTCFIAISFISTIINRSSLTQPEGSYFLPSRVKCTILGFYAITMVMVLVFFVITKYSKLHLLWFVPLFHSFGTKWLIPATSKIPSEAKIPELPKEALAFKQEIVSLKEIIRSNPQDANAYFCRGTVYLDSKNYNMAIQDFNFAIKLRPFFPNAFVQRSIAYAKLGKYEMVIQDSNKAIAMNPQDEIAFYQRGSAYAHLSFYDKAIQDFNMAINLKPEYDAVYYNRGVVYAKLGKNDMAIQDFSSYLKIYRSII